MADSQIQKRKVSIVGDPWAPNYVVPNCDSGAIAQDKQRHLRAQYSRALIFAGNTLCLWNQVPQLKKQLLRACRLQKNQKVLLAGTFLNGSGLGGAVKSVVGEDHLTLIDFSQKAIESLQCMPKAQLQWGWDIFASLGDKGFDRIILFSAASHIQNWEECAGQIHRILADRGRVIVAEAPIGGEAFIHACHQDAKSEVLLSRLLNGLGLREDELPNVDAASIAKAFKKYLVESGVAAQKGLYVFWGQKGAAEKSDAKALPASGEVEAFLLKKPTVSPWELLRPHEVNAWGGIVRDEAVHALTQCLFLKGWLNLAYDSNPDIVASLNGRFKAKTGTRILACGFLLREFESTLALLKSAGNASFRQCDLSVPSGQSLQKTLSRYLATCAEDHFDLIWAPQAISCFGPGVLSNLLKRLKKGGRFVVIDVCMKDKEWIAGLQGSGLLSCIALKTHFPPLATGRNLKILQDHLSPQFEIKKNGFLIWEGKKSH